MKDIYDYGAGYMYNRGRRFEGWKHESGKGKFSHFEWVLNADRYDLKINNEHVQYMDVFDPDFNQLVTPQDKRRNQLVHHGLTRCAASSDQMCSSLVMKS